MLCILDIHKNKTKNKLLIRFILSINSLVFLLKSCPAFLGDSMHFTLELHSHRTGGKLHEQPQESVHRGNWLLVPDTTAEFSSVLPLLADTWMESSSKQQSLWSLDSELDLLDHSHSAVDERVTKTATELRQNIICPWNMNIKIRNSYEGGLQDFATQTWFISHSYSHFVSSCWHLSAVDDKRWQWGQVPWW